MNKGTLWHRLWGVIPAAALLAVLVATQTALSQPSLNFKRIVNNWPVIELYFSVGCDGKPAYFFNKEQNFKVYENGIEVGEFTLWCPDPTVRCPISVALVFDASGSMQWNNGNQGAKAAGNAFIDLMDGLIDEAAIIWFNDFVNVQLGMTINLTDLHDAVNMLPAAGATACWDGVYAGISELINSGNNSCRAVIVLTDGDDNVSTRTVQDCIELARRNRIHVFTIGLGLVVPDNLLMLAELTGGQYYPAPSGDQLVAIYKDISTKILEGFQECLITYTTKCPDGGLRTVDLSLLQFCGGGDMKTKTYRAPKDVTAYSPLDIALGKGQGRGGTEVRIPLDLVTPINPLDNFEPASFELHFDPACMQFKRIETPPGSLLRGVPITVNGITNGVEITTSERTQIQGNGRLAEIVFQLGDPVDTTCCPVELANWTFDAGCFSPRLLSDTICIVPRAPVITCAMQMPGELAWSRSLKDYAPNPFQVTARLFNTGDREASNITFRIEYDPADIQLITPVSDTQPGVPVEIPAGETSEASWMLRAKTRILADSVEVCITGIYNNGKTVECCRKIWIPATEPILDCTIDSPQIIADDANQRYTPMPFPFTVTVTNRGGMKAEGLTATIILDGDLTLADGETFDKPVTPLDLLPNQSGSVRWFLKHPITLDQKEISVKVKIHATNADESECERSVIIPALIAPILQPACQTPLPLIFDESTGEYSPNPFPVTLQVVNMSPMPAHNVSAFLWLPDLVQLEPVGQSLRYDFGTLTQYKTGDKIPGHTWTVRYTKKLRRDIQLDFKWSVGGVGPTGIPVDTVQRNCVVDVPGLLPSFECWIEAPDSLGLNTAETNVDPNPFVYIYHLRNKSNQTATIQSIEVNYSTDGLALDPSSPPKKQILNKSMGPGEETSVQWVFKVENRINRRLANITAVAIDDEGNPVICPKDISIAALKTSLICNPSASTGRLAYDPIAQEYTEKNVTFTAELMNTSAFPLSNVTATLTLNDPDRYLKTDPSSPYVNPVIYPVLFPGERVQTVWHFMLDKANTSGITQYVEFSAAYSSNETPLVLNSCNAITSLDPVVVPSIICSLHAPEDRIMFETDHYAPNPFDVKLRIENIGSADAINVNAYILQDSRFSIEPGRPSSRHFDAIYAGKSIDFGDNEGFRLVTNPRATDGWDTVRVVVVANGIPESQCEVPIWVQAELRPSFEMNCAAEVDKLTFNDSANDYTPNPFKVKTTVTNIGTSIATNCQLVFVGPKKFTPFGQPSIHPVQLPDQTMGVGDTYEFEWKMKALRQSVESTEELVFQIVGYGGLNHDMVIGECRVPITIPAARAAAYTLACAAPDSILFDNSMGVYIPDPFTFKTTVTNQGTAPGKRISVSLSLEGYVVLANGNPVQTIDELPAGESEELTWQIRAVASQTGGSAKLCASLNDTMNNTAECCAQTFVPPATTLNLDLLCSMEHDSLTVNPYTGDYNESPFKVFLDVQNIGGRPLDDVKLDNIVFSYGSGLQFNDPSSSGIGGLLVVRLLPGESIQQKSWELTALPGATGRTAIVTFVVSAAGIPPMICNTEVYIPPLGAPLLECAPASTVDNDKTINFEIDKGDYEGILSPGSQRTHCTLTVRITNRGEVAARNVKAMVTLADQNAYFAESSSPLQSLGASPLAVNASGELSWDFYPIRQSKDAVQNFDIRITADNAETATCRYSVTIEGAPKLVDLSIPSDIVGKYNDYILVPIHVSPLAGRNVSQYRLNIQFDPAVLRYVPEALHTGTVTENGWNPPQSSTMKSAPNLPADDIIRIAAMTTGSGLNTSSPGVLVYLPFKIVYGGDAETRLQHTFTSLRFIESLEVGGKKYLSSMNSPVDDQRGDVTLNFANGQVTVSGECVVPLTATPLFRLEQNKPNPFNPSTEIEYAIGYDSHVLITVYDATGRLVRTLVDEQKRAGRHRIIFDAAGLASGAYIYRIDTPNYSEMKRMILAR